MGRGAVGAGVRSEGSQNSDVLLLDLYKCGQNNLEAFSAHVPSLRPSALR